MPVPQGFTITTEACTQYYEDGRQINDEILARSWSTSQGSGEDHRQEVRRPPRTRCWSPSVPARAQSMPGMMDTILNLGLNDEAVEGLAKKTGNARVCLRLLPPLHPDVLRRRYGGRQEPVRAAHRRDEGSQGRHPRRRADADDLKELVGQFKKIYKEKIGEPFPQDPRSSSSGHQGRLPQLGQPPRQRLSAKMNEIPYSWGTAVNVQSMAFGNMGDDSGTGVAFTRNPATGEKKLMGEYLINAQGEDVVAGVRTPMPISQLKREVARGLRSSRRSAPSWRTTSAICRTWSSPSSTASSTCCRPVTASAPRQAALQIACDLVDEGMITEQEAVLRVEPQAARHPAASPVRREVLKAADVIGKGLAASPGAACGKIVFSAEDAEEMARRGEKVVLVRLETSPEDIEGMKASQGILTVRGGMTSHAAVVARGMGTCCVSGCGDNIKIDEEKSSSPRPAPSSRGRLDLHRRLHRQHLRRRRSHRAPPPAANFNRFMGWATQLVSPGRPTPITRATRSRPWSSAPRASACAVPSTCSSQRTASRLSAR